MPQFTHAGLSFDVREGGPDTGEPVLLLHGFPQDSSSTWAAVEPLLHQAGLHTFAFDQRGYGANARPSGRRAYMLGKLVDDVLAMLDAAGLASAHIVGHDWGGVLGWLLAGQHPDRVRSLTVISTPHPRAMLKSLRSSTQALKSWYVLLFQLPVLPERMLARSLGASLHRSGLPKPEVSYTVERLREPGALTAALDWYRGLPLSVRTPSPRSTVPTTYVWGRHDFALGRTAAEATADFVRADYRFVDLDAGHWLPSTHPTEIATLITERVTSA
jgi:pimeloyl-ACP methyl ester carboxylesterase